MEKITLSLKNIYRLLMNDDFPIYSERVISKKQRKGQTLLRFWYDIMVHEFCTLPYGKMIWRNDGRRSRFFSNLCNRNEELKYYHEYAKEIGIQISVETLLSQIHQFENFLQSREYSSDTLRYRARGFLHVLKDDEYVTEAISTHLDEILQAVEANLNSDPGDSVFRAAYFLTVMTLYAAAGTAMGDTSMDVLRNKAFSMDALWEEQHRKRPHGSKDVRILTAHTGLLQTDSLSKDRFFGRESELFDLRDLAASGKKCLISGIGGVGKTELLRQLIRRCGEEHLVDKLAIIPYRTDLAESMIHAFPALRLQNQEDTLKHALHRLEKEAQDGTLLILIDNVTNDTDSDADLLRLGELPCTVMVTSRRKKLEGFETYPLSSPNSNACALIFRDNYGSPLSDTDRRELSELLSCPDFCHPLTLRLMARAAKSKNWSVGALRRNQLRDNTELTWVEDGRQIRIEQIFTQLYPASRIPTGCHMVIQLFTLLPRDSYQIDMLLDDFPQLFQDRSDLEDNLSILVNQSWLEQDDSGYSMHPLIAQCLRRKTMPESYLEQFLFGLRHHLSRLESGEGEWGEEQRIGRIFIHITQFLTGSISAALLLDYMDAVAAQYPTRQQAEQYQKQLKKMLRCCPDKDDTLEIVFHTLLCCWEMEEYAAVQAVFEKQQNSRSVPVSRFLDFCLAVNQQFCTELAELMLRVVLDAEDASIYQKAAAYRKLSIAVDSRGQSETALHWARLGAEFVIQHPECGEIQTAHNFAILTSLCLRYGRREEAKLLLDKTEQLEKKISMPDITISYLYNLGSYELFFGELENACSAMEKALAITDEHYGRSLKYYSTLSQLAIILQRQKRYDQAKDAYEQIFSFGKDHVYFNIARNNYAVLLLDMGKPQEALPVIAEVLSIARQQGGIALGEALRNKARAHGLLGDYEQEHACLTEALPLLEEAYGPEHPKAAAARERLTQLHGSK